jgi:hypothetical protein
MEQNPFFDYLVYNGQKYMIKSIRITRAGNLPDGALGWRTVKHGED